MSSPTELQDEEREVLLSIYDGDPAFNQLSPTVFQYKYGEHDNIKSFLVELKWTENYPNEKPAVNMDTFYNRNIIDPIKNKITDLITTETSQMMGEAMTYSLFELIKEHYDSLIEDQPDTISVSELEDALPQKIATPSTPAAPKLKKEQLSKAQKRRQWDRAETGARGEKPRGWDWVDIVKHLGQTGSKDEPTTNA